MLRVGLSGGIASGKSTVSTRLGELGAVVVDSDVLAREVVAPGSVGLERIRDRFGDTVIAADGTLDRPALGAVVFADPAARKDLEAITHPLVFERTLELFAAAPRASVVVHDIPLLVELRRSADYHLAVIVGADADVRLERMIRDRGMTREEAQARIDAQAGDAERQAAADVWLDNSGTRDELLRSVDALWHNRIQPFNDNLLKGVRVRRSDTPTIVPYDATWPAQATRLSARVQQALGPLCLGVQHVGSTSIPGLAAKDVIDLQVTVAAMEDADEADFVSALVNQGFPRSDGNTGDTVQAWAPDESDWRKRFHGSSDPGRVVHIHVREQGSEGWKASLLFRDWLRAREGERAAYEQMKTGLAATEATTTAYTEAKEPWIADALMRARAWAADTGWQADPTG